MKRFAAAASVATLGVAALPWAAPVGAIPTPTYSLSVAPNPSVVGTAVTVTPGNVCPDASTDVSLTYTRVDGTFVDNVLVPVEADGSWSDTVTPDHAGNYLVSGRCEHPQAAANAGHQSVASPAGVVAVDASYSSTAFRVDGLVTATPSSVEPGGTVTFSPTLPSRCNDPIGTATLTITDPDGIAVVTDAPMTLDADGSFAYPQALTKVGTYVVTGMCHRTPAAPTAGHLAAAQVQTDDFTYSGSATVTPAPTTTTTTTAPPVVAAEAVAATPRFTG